MIKKIVITCLILLVVAAAAVFFLKDLLLTAGLRNYLKQHLSEATVLERAAISFSGISLTGLNVQHEHFSIAVPEARIDFAYQGWSMPRIKRVRARGARLDIKDLQKSTEAFRTFAQPSAKPKEEASVSSMPVQVDIDNCTLHLRQEPRLGLETDFSFSGTISGSHPPQIERLQIDKFSLVTDTVAFSFHLEPAGAGRYQMTIDSIKRQDKEITNISLPLELAPVSVVVPQTLLPFLGEAAAIEARLDFQDISRILLEVNLQRASFKNIVNWFGSERDILFDGPFTGRFTLRWDNFKFSGIEGDFQAQGNGMIHIRKEVSLPFLERYLDKASYQVLVDSFNNYAYNIGKISVAMQEKVISIQFDFNSQSGGRRAITVNYHITGGGR